MQILIRCKCKTQKSQGMKLKLTNDSYMVNFSNGTYNSDYID